MNINKLLTPYNFTDKNDTKRIEYIVIHYVGALGSAKANCQYYAGQYVGASAHYYCGFDGEVWQSVADEDIAWHCGVGSGSYKHLECRNSNSIGIEICVRNKGDKGAESRDWYFEDATVNVAIELTRYLMEKYQVPPDQVIRHHDVTGKVCPNPYVFNHTKHTWSDFQAAIRSEAGSGSESNVETDTGSEAAEKGNGSYIITTTCDVLNIRSGAGTQYPVVGIISEESGKKRQYTIAEEKNGWGRLLSGLGWISMGYTQPVGKDNSKSFTIRTTCDVLNIRSGAGTQYPVVGTISERSGGKNQYTIVEEKSGWGRLLSEVGWIHMGYVNR